MVNASAGGGLGHLRVVPEGWNQRRDEKLRLSDWEAAVERVQGTSGVAVATARATVSGLLAMGTRSAHVRITGVDPATELRTTRYVQELHQGRYLRPGEQNAMVLGRTLAERLRVELDDELVATAVDAEGELQSTLLVVVGVAATGSRQVDATIAHVALGDVEQLSGLRGAAEITILVDEVSAIQATQAALATGLPASSELLTWLQIWVQFPNC